MESVEHQIRALVDTETTAWSAGDVATLVSLFHPHIVWPWPPDACAHDPAQWIMPLGRFDRERWKRVWQDLFEAHHLLHNNRKIVRVAVSEQGDGAFAVVDVDTLWVNRVTGNRLHWKGRACKVYSKVEGQWYFFFQTGLLDYGSPNGAPPRTA